jgi:hypothetical protein
MDPDRCFEEEWGVTMEAGSLAVPIEGESRSLANDTRTGEAERSYERQTFWDFTETDIPESRFFVPEECPNV